MNCIKCGKVHEVYKNDFFIVTIREFYGTEKAEAFVCKRCAQTGSITRRLIEPKQEVENDTK